ncbi:MAG: TonB-dependent receptor, partial [Chitinophagaceae bacterium]
MLYLLKRIIQHLAPLRKVVKPLWFIFITLYASASLAQSCILKGLVKEEETVLPSATVSVASNIFVTNSKGEFSIKINPGTYLLVVTHAGYRKFEQEIIIVANETKTVTIGLIRAEQLGEVVVLGSRSSIQRNNMNTPVPVEVIRGSQLPAGETGITSQLVNIVPSFNSPIQTLSPATVTNPAGLRGLGSDETLVLLNSRRRHTTSSIFTNGILGYGTVCTDLNAIPSAAIEKIEILRDGASAQYGSDAIAGVINLQLKKTTGITSVNLHLGQYYKGDGEAVLLQINHGFQLNKKGFLNFTAALAHSNPTQRNGIYDSTVYYNIPASGVSQNYRDSIRALDNQKIAERGFDRYNFRRIGNSEIQNTSFVLNGGYPLNTKTNLFWTGTMNYRIGDDRTNPVYRFPKDTTTVNTELYPDGFQAYVLSKWLDYSLAGGIDGKTNNGWDWDISSVYGSSAVRSTISNSNNASQFAMGKNAQTTFKNGGTHFIQNTNNLNFTRDFTKYVQKIKSLTASFGGEFRV